MTQMKRILLVEDDENISELVMLHLTSEGYAVDHAENLAVARQNLEDNTYGLIVLDLMLPDGTGMDLCHERRVRKDQTPIIILTAKSEEVDKVLGLEMGADDYIAKPFGVREFLSRIKAVLRRSNEVAAPPVNQLLEYGDLIIDPEKRKVTSALKQIELTKKEYELLHLLAKHPGINYSREQLLDQIWGYQFQGFERTVNSHMNRLRNKIEYDNDEPKYIITTWGVGYKFNDEL